MVQRPALPCRAAVSGTGLERDKNVTGQHWFDGLVGRENTSVEVVTLVIRAIRAYSRTSRAWPHAIDRPSRDEERSLLNDAAAVGTALMLVRPL
jgi:hypothetical protein